MISFIITTIFSIFVILAFVLKLCKVNLNKKWDIFICVVLPLFCLFGLIALITEAHYRRTAEIRELDQMIPIVLFASQSNVVFRTNEEKAKFHNRLEDQLVVVNEIAYSDTLLSIICGKNKEMTNRISRLKKSLQEQITWNERRNDLYSEDVNISTNVPESETMFLIGSTINTNNTINIAFKYNEVVDFVLCTYARVINNDSIMYSSAFENKTINCYTLPYMESYTIEIGYIVFEEEKQVFKYFTYGK